MLKVTGTSQKISEALNIIDARYFRGINSNGRSIFTIAAPSHKNPNGTITSYFNTHLFTAANNLRGMGLEAQWIS